MKNPIFLFVLILLGCSTTPDQFDGKTATYRHADYDSLYIEEQAKKLCQKSEKKAILEKKDCSTKYCYCHKIPIMSCAGGGCTVVAQVPFVPPAGTTCCQCTSTFSCTADEK